MSGTEQTSNNKYYNVIQGAFKVKSDKNDPEAESRINKKGVEVWERTYKAVFGKIENVSIWDGENGKQIKITLDKDEDGNIPVLSFNVESGDGKDIMEKLPAVNFDEEVRISPYRFTPDGEEKQKSGISIFQKDGDGKFTIKITNFFLKDKKPLHGYPTIDWDKASEADRKIYFIKRDEFLLNYLQEKVIPTFGGGLSDKSAPVEYPEEEALRAEEIPF